MSNKVTFGLRNVHVAFQDTSGQTLAFDTPIKIPGAVRFTPTAEGDTNTFYADDGPYFVVSTNNGYTAEIEMALIPDSVLKTMLGWEVDDNGMLVELADAMPKKFALMGEVQGDAKNRRFVYYDVQANRPAKERATKTETTEPAPDVLELTIAPVEIGGKRIVKGDLELSDTNATQYNAFFNAVYTPTFTPPVGS